MNLIALSEGDIVAELKSGSPVQLEGISYHASIDALQANLPAVVVMADAKPLIASNQTYELTVQLDLHTQADDMKADDARAFAQQLSEYVSDAAFAAALASRAEKWLPIRVLSNGFDAVDTEDRRYIQRVQLRIIAQG